MAYTQSADLKRLALQLAVQLPPNADEAVTVLKYAEHFVREFLAAGDRAPSAVVAE